MKVYRIQFTCYDVYGKSEGVLQEVYISKEVAEKHKPAGYELPHEECEYEVIEQEVIEN